MAGNVLLSGCMRMVAAVSLLAASSVWGSTLEKLSLEEMIQKSQAIVRAKVIDSSSLMRGPLVFTRYRIQVLERWKGEPAAAMEVAVPGGAYAGTRQIFSGAPTMSAGEEYLLFLWTSKSGLTQVIGLSQGLFDVRRDAGGELVIYRAASSERMIAPATGQEVADTPVRMRMRDLSDRIQRTLRLGAAK